MSRKLVCLLIASVTGLSLAAVAQQQHVNRFDLFTGYSHLSSPGVELQQNGFNTSFGINVKRWLALGADFSVFTGDGKIKISDTKIAGQVAALVPPGTTIPKIPFDATTYEFALGPQINIRHFEKLTIFVRPGFGLLHEKADLNIPTSLLPLLSLFPTISREETDTTYFYGAGGGIDLNASKHIGVRFSVDYVRTPLFSSFLETRNAVRFSVGPTWKWGELK